ncbi:MAG: DUF1214 domain-containing protein [Pseudomonadales bacterium]
MTTTDDLALQWDDFCDQLKSAGRLISADNTPAAVFDRAEGYRYLTRLLRAGLESQIESSNSSFPRFFQLANETIKIGNDNPDNIYHNANIDGSMDYRVWGTRGSVHYLSFGTKAGSYETTGTMEHSGHLDIEDIDVNDDGTFEIIISSSEKAGNWLPMQEQTKSLIVRQTFNDRAAEVPAQYHIECLNPRQTDTLCPDEFAKRLAASAGFVSSTAGLFISWMNQYAAHINQLPYDDQTKCQRAGGDSNIQYLQSYWRLADDEALVIHAKDIPECTTWNFQLSNYWMESLDYRHHTVSFNQHTAQTEADGSVMLVVSARQPASRYSNWIETCGHNEGGMLWRWVGADTSREYPVDCQVRPASDLM